MPRIVRDADVAWEGNLARGHGAMTAATSGAFIGLSYSLPTRIGDPEGKTSPEELLAAAHGGCFTMSLAGELTGAGTPPGRLAAVRVDGRIGHPLLELRVGALELVGQLFETCHGVMVFGGRARDGA